MAAPLKNRYAIFIYHYPLSLFFTCIPDKEIPDKEIWGFLSYPGSNLKGKKIAPAATVPKTSTSVICLRSDVATIYTASRTFVATAYSQLSRCRIIVIFHIRYFSNKRACRYWQKRSFLYYTVYDFQVISKVCVCLDHPSYISKISKTHSLSHANVLTQGNLRYCNQMI